MCCKWNDFDELELLVPVCVYTPVLYDISSTTSMLFSKWRYE